MATSEEIERATLCTELEYIAHELAQGRAASPQSVFTIQRAVEWIRASGKELNYGSKFSGSGPTADTR